MGVKASQGQTSYMDGRGWGGPMQIGGDLGAGYVSLQGKKKILPFIKD